MNWNVGTKIATGFGLALTIFVLVGAASYATTSKLIQAADLRKQSYTVLDELERVTTLLREMELGSRGYLLLSDESLFDESRAAADRLPQVLQRVRKLTGDNPRRQQRLDALEALIRSRIDHINGTASLHRSQGQKAAVQRILTGAGAALNTQIARVLEEMTGAERTLLNERSQEVDATANMARKTVVVGTLAGFLLAMLAGFLITRDISRPLQQLTACAERIKAGDLRFDVPAGSRSDEVGVLARAFAQMTQYLRGIANAAEQMAAGDLRSTVTPQSPDDVLGNAFQRMRRQPA